MASPLAPPARTINSNGTTARISIKSQPGGGGLGGGLGGGGGVGTHE